MIQYPLFLMPGDKVAVVSPASIINPDYVMGRYASEVQLGIKRALDAGVSQEKIDSLEGYTGAVGIWKTDRPGPVTALRFDIDALYLSETQDPQHLPNQCGFASQYIKFGEKIAVKYADEIIVLSEGVQRYFQNTYGRKTVFIPNGVNKLVIRKPQRIQEMFNYAG